MAEIDQHCQLRARETVKKLAEHFNIQEPFVHFRPFHYGSAFYVPSANTIVLPAILATEPVVLHEFSHALEKHKYEFDPDHHGPSFTKALVEVINYWYQNDPTQYFWKGEYKKVITGAEKIYGRKLV